jgi:hypothetical protein
LEYRVEHRGEVAGRGVDHPQDFAGRRLLLSCVNKFPLNRFAFGGPLIKRGFVLGKLALEIGDNLVGVG